VSPAVTSPQQPAARNADSTARPGWRTPRFLHFVGHSITHLVREWSFLAFLIAMPVTMYLFFSGIYGDQLTSGGVAVSAVMMVTMATYGGLGAAMNAGATIQSERSSGWFRQLMITPLTATEFVVAKICTALAAMLPALAAVGIAGVFRGVRLPVATWFSILGLLILALLPMVVLGLVIGLWFKQQTASAVTTLTMLALSMVGGLWFPLDMLPGVMQTVGKLLPSYWAGQIGIWPIIGGAFPWRGVLVLGIWVLVLSGLGALGYGRAVRTSRR
ncbi:MAG: ABC transporter permease, partial [Propionibacteriaceae bacterium]|nr:ABC transporter permease [Propionibacteriaceae bacterium]